MIHAQPAFPQLARQARVLAPRMKPLYASIAFALAGLSLPVHAQISSASSQPAVSATAKEQADDKPINAFAPTLRPKLKRTAALQNQPYTPIKKDDDQSQVPEIEMFVGESRVFPAPGVARIAVGNGQIMTAAALDNKEVLIFANSVGTSSLFVWNEDGRYQRVKVNIVPGDTTRIAREIASFLTAIPHAKASIVGDKVIVEGDDLNDADLQKVELLEKRYPQIVNFTNRLGWEQMVMMDVKVVEFPKSELRDIGVKWTPTGGAAIAGIWRPIRRGDEGPYTINIPSSTGGKLPIDNAFTDQSGINGVPLPNGLNIIGAMNLGLNAQLNLLAQDGKASVLAEPQLAARNGAKASFLAGGELPYSVSNINGTTIVFKPYGIKLDIVPKVDRNGVIRATIEAEVSSLDASVSTPVGPALLTRRTNTEFNVKNGETMVLSGLLQRDHNTDITKVPLLGDIPILGALFRSKRFQNKETELVIFVTPTVVDAHSPGLVDRVERTTERLQQNLGRTPYLSDPLQPGHDPARTEQRQPALPPETDAGAGQAPQTAEPTPVVPVGGAAPLSASGAKLLPATQNPLQPTAAARGSVLQVTQDGLVLRAKPNINSRALLQLGHGSIVQAGGAPLSDSRQGYWRNVVVGEFDGWVLATGVEPLALRAAAKPSSHSEFAQRDQGRQVLALGDTTGNATETVTAGSLQPLQRYRVTLERTALRVTPDVNAPSVANLAAGQVVEALLQAPQGHWLAVQVNGKRGWIASQWLQPVALQN